MAVLAAAVCLGLLLLPIAHPSHSGATPRGQLLQPELISTASGTHVRAKRSTKISAHLCAPDCTYRLKRHDGKHLIVNLTRVPDWGMPDGQEALAPIVHYMDDNDSLRVQNWTSRHCLYRARVEGETLESTVNLCHGMLGTLLLHDGVYFVEPVSGDQGFDPEGTESTHLLYQPKAQWFGEPAERVTETPDIAPNIRHRSKRATTSWDHYVEVLVVTDFKMMHYHGHNLENYVLTLFSTVATIYRHPSLKAAINIVVVRIVVLKNQGAGPLITENAQDTLKQFCAWQQGLNDIDDDSPNHHDVAILLTRQDICRAQGKCDTLGLAELGTMCDRVRSCAIIEDNGLSAAFTIAHELGHIFNIPHDDENKCGQYMALGKENYHIMAPTLEYNTHPWSWSPCSAAVLQIFLESGRASCLHDKPIQRQYMERMFESQAAGLTFDADRQCKFVFGHNAELCPYMPSCKRLWCATYYGYQVGCRTQHMPWADGTPCGNGMWCYRGECKGVAPEQLESVDGSWGRWKAWGSCSRTCGGGVRAAVRDCDSPPPSNGGRYCVGERVRYRSCNFQDCPWDTPGFREVQCSDFDKQNMGIHGVSEDVFWVPKYSTMGSSERCKLYCQVGGTAAFYLLKDKVIDGTPCERYADDICVDGTCRMAGCDHRLDSEMKRDRCGVCGGNGTKCRLVSGTNNERQNFGYNQVMRIPAGATNIDIRQRGWNSMKEDDNYLSLQNSVGEFILNGQYQISVWRQDVPVAGTVLEYSGSDTVVERINSSTVPTREDLFVHVLSVGNLYPPDIHFGYVIPTVPLHLLHQPTHYWSTSDRWTQCSSICNGIQTQELICMEPEEEQIVSDSECEGQTRPRLVERACNIDCEFSWRTENEGACSVECGNGEQQQRSVCVQQYPDRAPIRLEDSYCQHMEKPPSRIACHRDCQGRQWSYTEWAQCSASCGGGVAHRDAVCVDESNRRIDAVHCQQIPKESLQMECSTAPCPEWSYGHWAECTRSCDGGTQMRHASCQDVAGREVHSSMCNQSELLDRQKCSEQPCVRWKFGAWTQCSVTCGQGVATRDAWCVNSASDILEDRNCDKRQRIVSKPCELAICAHWKMTEWSRCSITCLDGWKTRRVTCVDGNNVEIDERRCAVEGEHKPQTHEPCNEGPCPFWRQKSWTACSVSCGSGARNRVVECLYRQEVVDNSYCAEQEEPARHQSCVLVACPQWDVGPWPECPVTCGGGEQRRKVQCMPLGEQCDEGKRPRETRECARRQCPVTTTTTMATTTTLALLTSTALTPLTSTQEHPIKWITGAWTECSTTCGNGDRRRQVICRDQYARLLPDIYCSHAPKPSPVEPCSLGTCGQWLTGAWTTCSQSCGISERRRQVSCMASQPSNGLEQPLCDPSAEPPSDELCSVPACEGESNEIEPDSRQAHWESGAWEECSRTCGSGWRRRVVRCMPGSEGKPLFCEPRTRPRSMEACQKQPCPRWNAFRWFQCSVTCGSGTEFRRVFCAQPGGPSVEVAESECANLPRPAGSRPCVQPACARPHWRSGPWSQCSTTCGKGVRTRSVQCVQDGRPLNDSFCVAGEKPQAVHRCRRVRCPRWRRTQWSPCSVTCGEGVRSRAVACYRGRRHKVSDTDCAGLPKPRQTGKCTQSACPNYRWVVTKWSNCSEVCKKGEQHRQVQCMSDLQQMAPPRMCSHLNRPIDVRECVSPTCPYDWTPGAWSSCNRSCGMGVRYRALYCRLKTWNGSAPAEHYQVSASMCSSLPKPAVTQPCSLGTCEAHYYWSIQPWSHCSVTCGKGVQRRHVRCINRERQRRVHGSRCAAVARPARKRMCFTRNCEPGNCAELRQFSNVTQDGDYEVLVNGFKVEVYCHQMTDLHPKTYLNLNPERNFAEVYDKRLLYPFTCPHNGHRNDSCLCAADGNPKAGKTRFSKVRVDLHNMKINTNDFTFAEQLFGQQVAYGSAGDCYSAVDCPQGEFNIDLRGTGFRVADAVRWVEYGHRTASFIDRLHRHTVVAGRCGGYCGQCYPDKWKGLLLDIDRRHDHR